MLQRYEEALERDGKGGSCEASVEMSYLSCWGHFRRHEHELACMKGEEVLRGGRSRWLEPTMRIMLTIKITERDFYGASYLIERAGYLELPQEGLSEFVDFI